MPNINAVNTGDKVSALAQDLLENKLNFTSSINQRWSKEWKAPEKFGDTIGIRRPLPVAVNKVRTAAPVPFREEKVQITVNKPYNVSEEWDTLETEQEISNFYDRALVPMMSSQANEIELDNISNLIVTAPIYSATATSWAQLLLARAQIQKSLADMSTLKCILNPVAEATIINAESARFNPAPEQSKMYRTGSMVDSMGTEFMCNTQIPEFETGSSTLRTGTIDVTVVEGATTVPLAGLTASKTIKKGEVFTVAGIFRLNPQSKATYTGDLFQFIVAADATSDGAGDASVTITEPVYATTSGLQNVSALPTATTAFTLKGAADSSYSQSLIYSPAFATVAFLQPKGNLGDIKCYHKSKDGIAIRYLMDGNGTEDRVLHRLDSYLGRGGLRGDLARRIIDFS